MFVTPGSRAQRRRIITPWSGVPGGRLTLATGTPFLNANKTAQTTVFLTPALHNRLPVWNGEQFVSQPFNECSVALDTSNVLNNNIYDVFSFMPSGVYPGSPAIIGYGPSWGSTTARAAGSAIARLQGILVNSVPITVRLSSTLIYKLPANFGVYQGSFYATANGQTGMAFTSSGVGGGAGVLGLNNMYNKRQVVAREQDTTSSWTISSTTWRAADNNANNNITFLDPIGDTEVFASYGAACSYGGASGGGGLVGINLNSTSATPANTAVMFSSTTDAEGNASHVEDTFFAALGLNVITAMERGFNASSTSFYGSGFGATTQTQGLLADLMM